MSGVLCSSAGRAAATVPAQMCTHHRRPAGPLWAVSTVSWPLTTKTQTQQGVLLETQQHGITIRKTMTAWLQT